MHKFQNYILPVGETSGLPTNAPQGISRLRSKHFKHNVHFKNSAGFISLRNAPSIPARARKFSTVSTISLRACALRKERIKIGFIVVVVVVIEFVFSNRILEYEYEYGDICMHLLANAITQQKGVKCGKLRGRRMWKTHLHASACKCNRVAKGGECGKLSRGMQMWKTFPGKNGKFGGREILAPIPLFIRHPFG